MGLFSKDLETVSEVIEELNEIAGIYKAILERENNPKIAYLELLVAHNMAQLSKIGLWMPAEFFRDMFLPFWEDCETQSYEPWRQVAATGSLLWLWLIANEAKLNSIELVFLKDQKAGLFFLIPDLLEKQQISPYVKNPYFGIEIQFDELKFASRSLFRSLTEEKDAVSTETRVLH